MPNFDRAQNTATRFLLQQDLDSLYIDVRNLKLPPNTFIESMQKFCSMTGASIEDLRSINEGACLLRQAGCKIILYDDEISNEQRKHWGIAHELGHALIGHNADDRDSEIEAHFFAAQTVMPEIVRKLRLTTGKLRRGLRNKWQTSMNCEISKSKIVCDIRADRH